MTSSRQIAKSSQVRGGGEVAEVELTGLPSRHSPAIYRKALEMARASAEAEATPVQTANPRVAWAVAMLVVFLAGVVLYGGATTEARGQVGSVPRNATITNEMVGLRNGMEAFTPAGERLGRSHPAASAPFHPPTDVPIPEPEPPPAPSSTTPSTTRERSRADGTNSKAGCKNCASAQASAEAVPEWEALPLELETASDGLTIGPPAAVEGALVNVGTRIPFILAYPVVTGPGSSPVSARLEGDVLVDGRVALPAGTVVVGSAFATEGNDRVQVVISSLVLSGRTIPVRGLALGVDNELGMRGTVIKKASGKRRGVGRVLRAAGSAVTFGLIGTGDAGMVGAAASELARTTGDDLQQLGQDLVVSDKVVRVLAGTKGILYLQGDLQL